MEFWKCEAVYQYLDHFHWINHAGLLDVDEIKAIKEPIIFCCKSGHRSGLATEYFKNLGVDCSNGGSWLDLM